jgi:hypothetical protein
LVAWTDGSGNSEAIGFPLIATLGMAQTESPPEIQLGN